MDYFKVFTDSIKLWWNNKYLWILGMIAVIFGGNSGSSSPSFSNNFSNNIKNNQFDKINFNLSTPIIIILIILFIFILLFILIGIYLKSRADASLITSVPLIEKNKKLSFLSSWSLSNQNWLKIFLIRLIISIPIIIFSFLVLIIAFVGIFTLSRSSDYSVLAIIGLIMIPFTCLIVVYAFITSILYTFASRIALIKNCSAWESIKLSWNYFSKNFSKLIVFWLLSLLVGFVVFPITLAIGLILLVPLIAVIIPLAIANWVMALILGILSLVFIGIALSLLSGPIYSFTEIYWTKVYLILEK